MAHQSPSEPLYGSVPYFGGEWTVTFRATESATRNQSGYGPFPRGEYPTIPVVDYRTGDFSEACRVPAVSEALTPPGAFVSTRRVPLAEALDLYRDAGVKVYEPGEPVPHRL